MSELVFATVITELKTSWAESIFDSEMIEFIVDEEVGRYGFLLSERNVENE
ncbi:MAG: hypothetical protein NC489_25380 [Ruminococcus flavefaciens]|nr:hypothetical protein [Ruminococcus flavefaciens]